MLDARLGKQCFDLCRNRNREFKRCVYLSGWLSTARSIGSISLILMRSLCEDRLCADYPAPRGTVQSGFPSVSSPIAKSIRVLLAAIFLVTPSKDSANGVPYKMRVSKHFFFLFLFPPVSRWELIARCVWQRCFRSLASRVASHACLGGWSAPTPPTIWTKIFRTLKKIKLITIVWKVATLLEKKAQKLYYLVL